MPRTVAIGEQDFSALIRYNSFYIDKTGFIKEWWENRDAVTLITRPRRFGKTLAMSMCEQFFSINYAGRADLFENLSVWKEDAYRQLQGTYPVIFLSFAGIKENSYPDTRLHFSHLITNLYSDFSFLLDSGVLTDSDRCFFKSVSVKMDDTTASLALHQLTKYLCRYYGKKVILLLDEYDTPMQEAYVYGYWKETIQFMRSLFNNTFKTNPYLERALMTGITRVSRESVFSDLNNLTVITTTSKMYETSFGFTEDEVFSSLEEFGMQDMMQEVKHWYDGFRFGEYENIYNPWSVINFLKYKEFKTYWANTSSNHLAGSLIQKSNTDTKYIMEDLLQGGCFHTQIDEEIIFYDLEKNKSAVWSLLLASGYLKVLHAVSGRNGKMQYTLALTNKEIRCLFDQMITGWFSNNRFNCSEFSSALLNGNLEFMNEYINEIAFETFSYFDTGSKPSASRQPENFYHGFVLGLTADLRGLYHITSNRESGNGRYDVMLKPLEPASGDGIILEFKVQDPDCEKMLQDTVRAALAQIVHKNYAAVLEADGIPENRIRIYGFAFKGSKILIDGGLISDYTM